MSGADYTRQRACYNTPFSETIIKLFDLCYHNGMDSDSKQATKVLAALVESYSRGMTLAHQFQSMSGVEKVSFDFD